MTRYVLEGEWSGYTSRQQRVVHREIISKKRYQALNLSGITFTDGTTLKIRVRPASAFERVEENHSHRELISEAEKSGDNWFYVKAKTA